MEVLPFKTHSTSLYTASQMHALLKDHPEIANWVLEIANLTLPKNIYLCNGGEAENSALIQHLIEVGTLKPLNPQKRPNSYLAWSDPSDVARLEDRTFVCTENAIEAGPNNNWIPPKEMKAKLNSLFKGCMKGRTLYVVPFCMGPLNSPYSRFGVEITDSAYVVTNMRMMTRMGEPALKAMKGKPFVKAVHSVGAPLEDNQKDVAWPCNPEKYIVHFPEKYEIWSFGSGYGGNALLGKKCFALRIGSYMAKKEGWLAEHMLIMGVKNPEGKKDYVLAAFPSACGKTNFAMMVPPSQYEGWKVTTVGDDIAWIHPDQKGQLRAINPENGFFGVAPGTSYKTNPVAMETIKSNTIFTNVALTEDGDVWWEGMTDEKPQRLTDWQGQPWTPDCGRLAAHPNARFTVNITQCPTLDENWDNPEGVPVSAFVFGGRRQDTLPLVFEPKDWNHGVYFAASIGSETTAAATGQIGVVRRDPMAMLPFCGYNMAKYFEHWLKMKERLTVLPKFFIVNWFKKTPDGKFAWPGFGQNMRVLEWILKRTQVTTSKLDEVNSPLGYIPQMNELRLEDLQFLQDQWNYLMNIDPDQWAKEIASHKEFFARFEGLIPSELMSIQNELNWHYGASRSLS
jgi:phosphoenolpyruvate carboxykinase (GTP)